MEDFNPNGGGTEPSLPKVGEETPKDALDLVISEAPEGSQLARFRYAREHIFPLIERLEDEGERSAALDDVAKKLRLTKSDLRKAAFAEFEEKNRQRQENEYTDEEEEDGTLPIPYRETPHGLVWDRPTKVGVVPIPLTNFKARITTDIVEDDGAEERRSFEIETELHGRRSVFSIPAERYSGMGWSTDHLGAEAIVYPGFGLKDHARAGIQMLSGDVLRRHVYGHTGWRRIGEKWVYLHSGGAIGPIGPIPGIEVSLGEGRLGDYLLPDPPQGKALTRAVRTSLRFLELAPWIITVPMFCAVYRAVLGEKVPVDLSLHAVGPTGAFKTELVALAQAHYGSAFNGRNLPGNWSSTENALEKLGFILKDALFVVDDFAPTGTSHDMLRLHRMADRLLRAQGNRSGRIRMRADTNLRTVYYPRGLILSTGEDTPRGQSLRARMHVVEFSPGDVDLEVLTELQHAAAEGTLAAAMGGYVRWLAPQMNELKERLPDRQRELRARAIGAGAHARTPDVVASLGLGLEEFLEFAVKAGAIAEERANQFWDEGWHALLEAAKSQAERQGEEEPTRQFLELLTACIVAGDAYVANAKTGEEPEDAERWGWRSRLVGSMDFSTEEWHPQGRCVGWLAEDGSLLLEPGVAFATAQQMAHRQSTSLPIGQRTLWKRLAEKGLLASRDAARGRNTTRATIAGERRVVVHLIPGIFSPKNGPNGPRSSGKEPSGPKARAVPSASPPETARENGPDNLTNGVSGPKGSFPGEEPAENAGGEDATASSDSAVEADSSPCEEEDEPWPTEKVDHLHELTKLGWFRAQTTFAVEDSSETYLGGDPVARRLRYEVPIYYGRRSESWELADDTPWVGSAADVFELEAKNKTEDELRSTGWPATPEEMASHLRRVIPALQAQPHKFYDPGLSEWYSQTQFSGPRDSERLCKEANLHAEVWKKEGTSEELWALVALRPRWRLPDKEIEWAVWLRATGQSPIIEIAEDDFEL